MSDYMELVTLLTAQDRASAVIEQFGATAEASLSKVEQSIADTESAMGEIEAAAMRDEAAFTKTEGSLRGFTEGFAKLSSAGISLASHLQGVEKSDLAVNKAQISLQQSTLNVERAQKAYADAVKKSGSGSDEAKTAFTALQLAQEKEAYATDRAEMAQGNYSQSMLQFAASILPTTFTAIDAVADITENWGALSKATRGSVDFLTSGTVMQTIATKAQTLAQWDLNAAMAANPIGVVVMGLVALGAAVWGAYTYIKPFHDAVDALGALLINTFRPILEAVGNAWRWLTGQSGEAASQLSSDQETLQGSIEATGQRLEELRRQVDETADASAAASDKMVEAYEGMQAAQSRLIDLQLEFGRAQEAQEQAARALAAAIDYVTGRTDSYTPSTEDAVDATLAAHDAYEDLTRQLGALSGEYAAAAEQVAAMEDAIDSLSDAQSANSLEEQKIRDAIQDRADSVDDELTALKRRRDALSGADVEAKYEVDLGNIDAEIKRLREKGALSDSEQKRLRNMESQKANLTAQREREKSAIEAEAAAIDEQIRRLEEYGSATDEERRKLRELESQNRDLSIAEREQGLAVDAAKEALDAKGIAIDAVKTKMETLKTAADNYNAAVETTLSLGSQIIAAMGEFEKKSEDYQKAMEDNTAAAVVAFKWVQAYNDELAKIPSMIQTVIVTVHRDEYESGGGGGEEDDSDKSGESGGSSGSGESGTGESGTGGESGGSGSTSGGSGVPNPEDRWWETPESGNPAAEAYAATGFEGIVTEPTRFMVGEAGPEHVSVTPLGRSPSTSRGSVNFSVGDIHLSMQGYGAPPDPEEVARKIKESLVRELAELGATLE